MGNISINDYNKPQITLTSEDRYFIELVNNRITAYGQIPYTVPQKLIIGIIKESALYFFRLGYWRSQQVCFYRLPKQEIVEFLTNAYQHPNNEKPCDVYPDDDEFNTGHKTHHVHPEKIDKSFKNLRGYAIKLPPFVNAVREIYESNKKENSTQEIFDSTADLVFRQQMSPYGYSLMGINSNLYIYEVCCKITEQAAWQSVMGTSVPFRYNNATKTLILNKEIADETVSLMLQCDCNVNVQYLYQDDLFIDYVIARCKQELRRVLAGHTFQLPGDVQMNADDICYNADTDVQNIREQLKGATGIGDLILQR